MLMMTIPDESDHVEQVADLFHLLGDATRLRIVLACLAQPTAVGDIATALNLSSSLVSHHLRLLRAARIVKAERQGKQVFYAAADAHISTLLATMFEHIAEPLNALDAARATTPTITITTIITATGTVITTTTCRSPATGVPSRWRSGSTRCSSPSNSSTVSWPTRRR